MENNDSIQGRIAIVGFDCRFPGADNIHELWDNLVAEKESLVEFSDEQLLASGIKAATFNNPNYVRRRGVVEGTDQFDAEFFNFTPREAELLDPQHRLFLECAWHALEDAGVDPSDTEKRIAVFGGTGSPYHLVKAIGDDGVKKYASGTSIITSNDKDYLTTRVSYKLNLKGPSVSVQCACSTSMVSVVLGIDSLLNYQSDVVMAGGVTVEIPEHQGYMYQSGGLESPDGRCRTFDKDAAGTVFSRGCGVVALKRLEDALEDKDHIYAVILGGAVNNDGNRKAGYTAPSVQGQVDVITESIEMAGIDPSTITMVEAHGTSTPVGDPIEVASLSEAFSQYTKNRGYCAIGSIKTNIGHTDVASGIASMIKTCLSLKYGIIPASLNYKEPNPAINFTDSPFYVNTSTKKWETLDGMPRRALINSFGVGGTNACVVLEEPPRVDQPAPERRYDLLYLSAHHKKSFEAYRQHIRAFIEARPEANLNALAHTSRVARKSMKYKAAIAFKDREDLLARLEEAMEPVTTATTAGREFVWMFPGQGNQFVDMGKQMYQENRVFREAIDHCSDVLEPLLGLDIREILYPSEKDREQATGLMALTYITQPAIFMVSYAVARVFQAYGLNADALIGHSVGEYVAAAISGIMSLDDALKAVAFRGKLVYELPQGSMLAVLKSEEELKGILPPELDIAVINSPEVVVVSGATPDIEAFAARMKEEGTFTKLLPTSHAFHSRMMEPCLERYREFFKGVPLHAPRIPIISTVTGQLLSEQQATDHEYWVQHVVDPVLFSHAAAYKLSSESVVFLECGPGQSLESAIKRRLTPEDRHAAISTLHEHEDATIDMDAAIGKLWIEGITFDDDLRFDSSAYQKVIFPLLPFNRRSYRVDFSESDASKGEHANEKKENIGEWFYIPSWKRTPSVDFIPRNRSEEASEAARWLVFSNNGFGDAIAARIREAGKACVVVRPGERYLEEDQTIHIRMEEKDDYRRLLARMAEHDQPLRIMHAWNYADPSDPGISLTNADQHLNQGFYSLLYLGQGLAINNLTGRTRLSCLIDDGFNVTGGTRIRAEKSLSLGPVRVLFKEHPEMTTRLINLETGMIDVNMQGKLIEQLIKESEIDNDETIVSYSGMNRWTEVFESVDLPDQQENIAGLLRDDGVYLITGGGGGIGRTLSLLIAEQRKSTIIWTGRGSLPPRQEWEALIAQDGADPVLKDKLEAILKIERLGSVFRYFSVEVSDAEGMARVVQEIESEIGAIHGIVHSAGTAGGGVVALQDKNETEKVLKPKVIGTLVLQELFKDKPLDFIYLFSSITAVFGEAGRVDYTSGNAFLDAMCNARFLESCDTVCSVNWGQWGVIGMAADWQRQNSLKKAKAASPQVQDLVASDASQPMTVSQQASDGARETYSVRVNAEDHWVLNEHLLSGMPTLIGASFLDVLEKWKALKGIEGDLVVHQGEFSSPLMIVNKAPRELQLVCEPMDSGSYRFLFRSRGVVQSDSWKEHFSGTLSFASDGEAVENADIPSLIARFPSPPNLNRHFLYVFGENNRMLLQYSSRWDCREELYIGKDEWLTKLELPERFAQDFAHFDVHPAMLDVATSSHFMNIEGVLVRFLPYAYGEVRIIRPFTPRMYSHTKLSRPYEQGDPYIYFDFDLYSESGEAILSMKDYAFAKVGEAIDAQPKQAADPQKSSVEVDDGDILPEEGKQVLGILLGQKELPQIIVYTKDLVLDFKESKVSYKRKKLLEQKKAAEQRLNVDDRPDIDSAYEEPENEIEKSIAAIWSSILGINQIGVNDSFNELGGNSLLAIQVISGMGEEFGLEIQANEFVNNATIRALGELVLSKILEEHETEDIEMALNEGLNQP